MGCSHLQSSQQGQEGSNSSTSSLVLSFILADLVVGLVTAFPAIFLLVK
jgi:hypothetical protein